MGTTEILNRLAMTWADPRPANHRGRPTPFPLSCRVQLRPKHDEPPGGLPEAIAELWQHAESARLFEDRQYGQWGLLLFSEDTARQRTREARAARAKDFTDSDLVVGEFLGDSEVLVVRGDPGADDFGHVLIALPLDPRRDWYEAADDFEEFLQAYERAEGSKFWEGEGG